MKKEHLPLLFVLSYIVLSIIFLAVLSFLGNNYDFGVEGGPLQAISFFWFFISIIIFAILGIWAIVKGIKLMKKDKKNKWGITNLILGLIIFLPAIIFILKAIFSVLMSYINPQYT